VHKKSKVHEGKESLVVLLSPLSVWSLCGLSSRLAPLFDSKRVCFLDGCVERRLQPLCKHLKMCSRTVIEASKLSGTSENPFL
jgi:hypothetical protein